MSRIQSPVTNLGLITATPRTNSITAAIQFANAVRPIFPLISLTPTSEMRDGDFGTCLIGGADYGKLMRLHEGAWINATPASNLAGYVQAAQIQANSITANQMAADSIVAGSIAALALDGKIITGTIIRTAATGARVEINSSDGLKGLDSAGHILAQITTAGAITLKTKYEESRVELTSTGLRSYNDANSPTFYLESGNVWAKLMVSPEYWVDTGSGSLRVIESDGKVDGVDVSAHAASATVHGVTGNVVGTNMTNTLGASGIIDAQANSAKIKIPSLGNGSTDTASGDGIFRWWGSSGVWFCVNDGSSIQKVLMQAN